jgi:hypothetical protein
MSAQVVIVAVFNMTVNVSSELCLGLFVSEVRQHITLYLIALQVPHCNT